MIAGYSRFYSSNFGLYEKIGIERNYRVYRLDLCMEKYCVYYIYKY